MSHEYQLAIPGGDIERRFSGLQVPLRWPALDRDPTEPIRPAGSGLMVRATDPADPAAGLEGVERRWWLVPAFHKGPVAAWKSLCVNAPIETLDSSPAFREAYRLRRALIPVTSFFAYHQPPGWQKGQPKRRWEVSWEPTDESDQLRWFAGIWERSEPTDLCEPLESFAIVTGPSGPDVAPVQDRQPALLTLEQGLAWLDLTGPGKAGLVTETPAGTYRLEEKPRDALMSREMRRAL